MQAGLLQFLETNRKVTPCESKIFRSHLAVAKLWQKPDRKKEQESEN